MRGRGGVRAVPDHPAVPLTPRTFAAGDYPAEPYPGACPPFSFALDEADVGREVDAGVAWAARGERVPVLAYGSNACPSKIAWLRSTLGLRGEVVVLQARYAGLAAVWAAGLRVVDDQRPATLTALAGVTETHAVWLATADQLRVLDVCEGRGDRYALARVHSGRVTLADGTPVPDPLAYVGLGRIRMPLLLGGRPVRCAEVGQDAARHLVGEAGESTGLDVTSLG